MFHFIQTISYFKEKRYQTTKLSSKLNEIKKKFSVKIGTIIAKMEAKASDESLKALCPKIIYRDALTQKLSVKRPIFDRLIRAFVICMILFTCIILLAGWIVFLIDYFIVDECFQKILEPTNNAVIFKYDDGKIVNLTKCNSPHFFRSGLLLLRSFEMINLLNSIFIILGIVITGVILILILFFCATYTYVKQNYKIDFI